MPTHDLTFVHRPPCIAITSRGIRCRMRARPGHETCGMHKDYDPHRLQEPLALRRLRDPLNAEYAQVRIEARRSARRRTLAKERICPVCERVHWDRNPVCSTWCAERYRQDTKTPLGTRLKLSG